MKSGDECRRWDVIKLALCWKKKFSFRYSAVRLDENENRIGSNRHVHSNAFVFSHSLHLLLSPSLARAIVISISFYYYELKSDLKRTRRACQFISFQLKNSDHTEHEVGVDMDCQRVENMITSSSSIFGFFIWTSINFVRLLSHWIDCIAPICQRYYSFIKWLFFCIRFSPIAESFVRH